MLYILTGDIQIGKTRWLQALVESLAENGVPSYGVVAPGVWREAQSSSGQPQYEKLGINNVLLPNGQEIPFAKRRRIRPKSTSIIAK